MNSSDSVTIPFLLLLLVVLPALALRTWFRLRSGTPLPPKLRRFQGMIWMQILLFGMTTVPARRNGIALFAPGRISLWIWLAAAAYLALIAVRTKITWPRLSNERRQKARTILPENPSEMLYWIPISILAGVTEEYAYRGVAFSALLTITRSMPLSLMICIAAFAVAHITYGWRAVLSSALLALLFHLTVFVTQTLSLVICFHVAYDLTVGILGMWAFMREGTARVQELPVTY
jgi:hypothetical protein